MLSEVLDSTLAMTELDSGMHISHSACVTRIISPL